MLNQSKPTTVLSNSPKASIGETWSTITTTWATETRTWGEVSKLIENTFKPAQGYAYLLLENGDYLLQENGDKLIIGEAGGIINQSKP